MQDCKGVILSLNDRQALLLTINRPPLVDDLLPTPRNNPIADDFCQVLAHLVLLKDLDELFKGELIHLEGVRHLGLLTEFVRTDCLHHFHNKGRVGREAESDKGNCQLVEARLARVAIIDNREELAGELNVFNVVDLLLFGVLVATHPVRDLSEENVLHL